MNERQRIAYEATQLPEHFSLRAFPNEIFTVNLQYSYVNDNNEVCLVIDVIRNGAAINFGKGTLAELKSQLR